MAHLLFVDDDLNQLQLKKAILEKAEHTVDTSSSIEDALSLLEMGAYDAVLADWWFGAKNSMRIVMKAEEKDTPVLVVSGFAEEALLSLGSAADHYLQKPVSASDLTAALHQLLTREEEVAE